METASETSSKLEYSSFSVLSLSDAPKMTESEQSPEYLKVFSSLIMDQLNTQDMKALLESQQAIMKRLDEANKNITTCNQKSLDTFNSFGVKDFQSYINLLIRMKQDLDFIFKRVRILKKKLELKYPQNYSNALKIVKENKKNLGLEDLDEEDEEDEEEQEEINEKDILNNDLTKNRSDSLSSRLSSSKSVFANFFENARTRISSFNQSTDPAVDEKAKNSENNTTEINSNENS